MATPIASHRAAMQSLDSRTWNLALAFQEVFTAVVRLRFNRQAVSNAEAFRAHVKQALGMAQQDAHALGFNPEAIQTAAFAVIAFLDESVLASRNPVFADWPRLPLQEELFGGHMAGETFFVTVQKLLSRPESTEVADLLEVYLLCLLLGYRGRYGVGGTSELRAVIDQIREKIRRVRGLVPGLSPRWAVPADAVPAPQTDPWVRRLRIAAIACLALAILMFAGYKFGLITGASDLLELAARGRP